MVACIKVDVDSDATPDQTITTKAKGKEKGNGKGKPKRGANACLAEILVPRGSPYSMNNSDRHIVIVLDPLKHFSRPQLEWTFDYVVPPGCTVTFLGVMSWLPMAFSCKARFWSYDFGNMLALKGRSDWKNEEIRGIIELCEEKGVVPYIQLAMGNSLKLVVLEKASSLHATLVVLDRRHRKNKAFFAERLKSSVVMMNSDRRVDMIKVQSTINCCDSSPDQEYSPETPLLTKVILSEKLFEFLNQKDPEKPLEQEEKSVFSMVRQCRTMLV